MISVSGKKWEQKKINQNLVDRLKQDFNFNDILSRLIISRKFDKDEKKMGISDLDKKYELNEIIKGDSIFCSTGITSSEMLDGIEIHENKYISETLVTHKSLKFKEIIKRTNLIEE